MKDKDDNSSNLSEFRSVATEDINTKYEEISEDSLCKFAFFKEIIGNNLLFKRFILISDFDCYPQRIIDLRNYLIASIAVHILCGLMFLTTILMFNRESFDFLGFLIITMIGVLGTTASIQVNKGRLTLLTYSTLFGSIIIPTLILLDNLMDPMNKYSSNYITELTFEFLYNLIYMYPLVIAFLSRKLVKELNEKVNIDECNEIIFAKNEIITLSSQFSENHIKELIEKVDDKLCFICKKKERNTILLPCTHSVSCINCVKMAYQGILSRKWRPRCPECGLEIGCYYRKKSRQEDKSFSYLRFKPDKFLIKN